MNMKPGNPLGAVRAESDSEMLENAFVETSEYRSLTQTHDFHFVVGRRGTGKSALCAKVAEYYRRSPKNIVIIQTPEEHAAILFREALSVQFPSDYKKLRQISRLIWRLQILFTVAIQIARSDRLSSERQVGQILSINSNFRELTQNLSCNQILKYIISKKRPDENLLEVIPRVFPLKELEQSIREILNNSKFQAIVIYDGLDEGWIPDMISTAVVGGLAIAVADLTDAKTGIYAILFVRDNMFRLLASTDEDFSRHIEGATLRLHWDVQSLFVLICRRIRVVYDLSTESDVKVWNRFAVRELAGIDGFRKCLLNTLYRPRDVLVLLNAAYQIASKQERGSIIGEDVESAARHASHNRLEDLVKEYHGIFLGIAKLTSIFRGTLAACQVSEAITLVEKYKENVTYDDNQDRDLALLGTAREVLFALYSIGFIGKYDSSNRMYTFCHDGTLSEVRSMSDNDRIMIHPCYWMALDIQVTSENNNETVINQINDEYEQKATRSELDIAADVKVKRIGTILGELSQIEHGHAGDAAFGRWVLAAVQSLCSGSLSAPRLVQTEGIEVRTAVLANITAMTGVWKKIGSSFQTRHALFVIVNFDHFKTEDILAASSTIYGMEKVPMFRMLLVRSDVEMISESEGNILRTHFSSYKKPIVPMPSTVIARSIRKLRNPGREDYLEIYIKKRLEHIYKMYYDERRWSL